MTIMKTYGVSHGCLLGINKNKWRHTHYDYSRCEKKTLAIITTVLRNFSTKKKRPFRLLSCPGDSSEDDSFFPLSNNPEEGHMVEKIKWFYT